MDSTHRAWLTKKDPATIAWVCMPFLAGCGVMLILFKLLPREFGSSGTLVVSTAIVVYGLLIIVTGMLAIALNRALFSVDIFLLTLLVSRYYLFPKSMNGLIFLGGLSIMFFEFIGINYLSLKLKGNLPK